MKISPIGVQYYQTDYLKGYSASQLKIIFSSDSVVQVVAAAGSGKTRTVVGYVEHRLRSDISYAGRILLITFSRKAAEEMQQRFPSGLKQSVEVSTFHSFCFRHLSNLHPGLKQKKVRIMEEDEKMKVLKSFFRENQDIVGGIPYGLILRNQEWFEIEYPGFIDRLKNHIRSYKEENHLLEYDDLIRMMLEGLRGKVNWINNLRKKYRLIVVDEFQDTDPDQLEFVRLMNPPELLVVGDDYQSIYGFRGATVKPFLDFSEIYKEAAVYRLAENYRSREGIVEAGNGIIRNSSRQLKKRVRSIRGKGESGCVFSLEVKDGQEVSVGRIINSSIESVLLVRSNSRARFWIRAGVREDRIMTIHKSKGLEFPAVFLDLSGGWGAADSEKMPDEEIRIAYVGITRAMDNLVLLYSENLRESSSHRDRVWWELVRKYSRTFEADE